MYSASQHRRREIVQYFSKEWHLDSTTRAKNGQTALHLASQINDVNLEDLLINAGRVDVSIKVNHGLTALQMAAERGHLLFVCILRRRW